MKRTGLFLILLTLSMCLNEYYNVDKREDADKCVNGIINDLNSENKVSVSDCVDRKLAIDGGGLFDKCCYYRMMINGKTIEGCTGLSREDTMDVPGYIELSEKQIKESFNDFPSEITENSDIQITDGTDVKIYSINCEASYIKFFIAVFGFFCLLF